MPSFFDQAFSSIPAAALLGKFAERDSNDAVKTVKYHPPDVPGTPALELDGGIWSAISYQEVFDDGEVSRRESRTLDVLRSECDRLHISGVQRGGVFEDPDGPMDVDADVMDNAWMIDEATTVWEQSFVTFGLVRVPLVAENELRRGTI